MANREYQLIMGRNCVQEVLRHQPERLLKVFVGNSKNPLLQECEERGIPVKITSSQELNQMVCSESHQGVVARVKEKAHVSLKEFLAEDRSPSLVLMLDSIFDPQNLGALLRAAECFGADAVIWSKNRGADITPVVTKASVGASELVPTIKVSNLGDALKKLQDAGYWAVTAEIAEDAHNLNDYSFNAKTVLIMGSEGKGVQALLSKRADDKVYIPMHGNIDSLNVSQATSVILARYRLNQDF